ncbi:MAG: MlaD family protein [Candidatus Riflemargulisbacteria bacterium]
MKIETKVGLFVFFALLVLSVGIIWKSSLLLRANGYVIIGSFDSVNGLLPGAEVRYRGFLVGTVSGIDPDPYTISVKLYVKRGINITEGSSLRVDFDGLIGEKYINIIPNTATNKYLKPGATLRGHTAAGLVDFVNTGTQNLNETKQILEVFRKIFTNKKSEESIQQFILNMDSITSKLDSVLGSVDGFLTKRSMAEWSNRVDHIIIGMDNLVQNLNALVGSVESTEDKSSVYKMVSNLESFTKTLQKESGSLIKNAKNISYRLDENTNFLDSTSLNMSAAILDNQEYGVGAFLSVSKNEFGVVVGNKGTGTSPKVTQLTYGRSIMDGVLAAVGLVENSPGVKVDHQVTKTLKLEHSLYNATTWMYRLKTNLLFAPNIKGIAGYDYHSANDQKMFIGVGLTSF